MRVALRFAYDGSAFESYARQPGRRTVEGALMAALAHEGLVEGTFRTGSRTDAGVSAAMNVCAADLERVHLRGLVPALQQHLPAGLWATAATPAPDGFDPRKAAFRQYRHLAPRLGEDGARMRDAAALFLGTHHMGAFARLEAGRDPVRTVEAVDVAELDAFWEMRVRGQSFLWGQVRRMVGALVAVGMGHAEARDIEAALADGRPHPRFTVASAEGLMLERVHYDGLAWDPAAGQVDQRTVTPALVQARVRLDVARLVAGEAEGGA